MDSTWTITQEHWDPERELFYESIFSLGNGYMGVRGFKGEEAGRARHENGIFVAGLYDELKPGITDMVNTPDFMHFRIAVDGEPVGFADGRLKAFNRVLDMRAGVLQTSFAWHSDKGKILTVNSEKLISLHDKHLAGVLYEISADADAEVSVCTGINGDVCNNPIADEQLADNTDMVTFLTGMETEETGGLCRLKAATRTTGYGIGEAFAAHARIDGIPADDWETDAQEKGIYRKGVFALKKGQVLRVENRIAVYTSRDTEWCDWEKADLSEGYDVMRIEHESAWRDKWDIADISIEGDEVAQQAVRYGIFQLIQANAEDDPYVSIGARGLLHGRYKGCYFWDTEVFMLPFYLYTNPRGARNLLLYRYHTLPGAECNARRLSMAGAKYAWMSTITGEEQCETWDIGCCEVHVTADIAYTVWQYYLATHDRAFITEYGAEILVKTARYWVGRFTHSPEDDRYHMLFVKGPDEYGGVTQNNTYTTMMAIYNMKAAQKAMALVKAKDPEKWDALCRRTGFEEEEIDLWEDIAQKAVIAYDAENDLYIEDEASFLRLEPLDVRGVKKDDCPLYRTIAYDRLQRYRVLKQADVIQLMLLLPHLFNEQQKRAAWDHYEPITAHDSSLSFGSHAMFAARLGLKEEAYAYFMKSARLDLGDLLENTAVEGVHPAAFGITWQALVNGFGGVMVTPMGLHINPCMADDWDSVRFHFRYGEGLFSMTMNRETFTVRMEEGSRDKEASFLIYGETRQIMRGECIECAYGDPGFKGYGKGFDEAV